MKEKSERTEKATNKRIWSIHRSSSSLKVSQPDGDATIKDTSHPGVGCTRDPGSSFCHPIHQLCSSNPPHPAASIRTEPFQKKPQSSGAMIGQAASGRVNINGGAFEWRSRDLVTIYQCGRHVILDHTVSLGEPRWMRLEVELDCVGQRCSTCAQTDRQTE